MMFVVTTLCAFLAALARAAGNGGAFARAMTAAAAFVGVSLALYLVFFMVAWCAAVSRRWTGLSCLGLAVILVSMELRGLRLFAISNWPIAAFAFVAGIFLTLIPHRNPDVISDNPFAEDQLPPQILPPREKSL